MADITVRWLLDRWRVDIDDPVQEAPEDQLWTDAEGLQYLDEAQKAFCADVDCIPDATMFAGLSVAAQQAMLPIDPIITKIRRAILPGSNQVLRILTMHELQEQQQVNDYGFPRSAVWESMTGTPTCLITDYEIDRCRLVPIPAMDTVIDLAVYRLPLDIESTNDDLEIPNKFRVGLLHKMEALAYAKQDADTFDAKMVQYHEAAWRQWLMSCARQHKVRAHPISIVSYGGY